MTSWANIILKERDVDDLYDAAQKVKCGQMSLLEYNELSLKIRQRCLDSMGWWPTARYHWRRMMKHFQLRKLYVNRAEYVRRISICNDCEFVNNMAVRRRTIKTCKMCGCFLQAKARLKGSDCPHVLENGKSKWNQIDES